MGDIRRDISVRRFDDPTYKVDGSEIRYVQSIKILMRIMYNPDIPGNIGKDYTPRLPKLNLMQRILASKKN